MSDSDSKVLVVPTKTVFSGGEPFNGFRKVEESGIPQIEELLSFGSGFRFREKESLRIQAPEDEVLEYKQLAPYIIIINPKTSQVCIYRHCESYEERRTPLRGLWGFGIRADIKVSDHLSDTPGENNRRFLGESLVYRAIGRVVDETLEGNGKFLDSKLVGYINEENAKKSGLDEEDLERGIMGAVYILETDSTVIKMVGDESITSEMAPAERLVEVFNAGMMIEEEEPGVYLGPWAKMVSGRILSSFQSYQELSEIIGATREKEERERSKHGKRRRRGR
ncbi:MAG: hypothetical protein AABW73_00055 [Nanoarchaeota archaeon]